MKQLAPRQIAVGVVILGLVGALYLAAQPPLSVVQTKNCQINLKQIGMATIQYVRDYDEQFPIAARWANDLKPYAKNWYVIGSRAQNPDEAFDRMFRCPTTGSFYAYNRHLETVSIGMITDTSRVPLAIEVNVGNPQINFNGVGQDWPASPIHEEEGARGNHVVFADGHVELTKNKPIFRPFATPTPKSPKIKPAQTAKP